MHDDLIKKCEIYQTAKEIWNQLKVKFGGTITTRLRALILKFNQYTMNPKHSMVKHFKVMSSMTRELQVASNNLTTEQ